MSFSLPVPEPVRVEASWPMRPGCRSAGAMTGRLAGGCIRVSRLLRFIF